MAVSLLDTELQTPAAVSDEVLVDRLRGGQAQAGEELVNRYCKPLLRYLQSLVQSDQMAEELLQQTWLSVLDHIDRFDVSGGGFRAWVYRIATNKANDHWRVRGREKTVREGLKLVTATESPDAGYPIEQSEQVDKLRLAIDRLPENQRQVLLLRYYSGLKFVEIAQTLGCPLNTALGRMHKALQKLKQLMES
jgi:RNA polymerase sigma-70 factor (ECF subfamily)